jgi:hypothetical protein
LLNERCTMRRFTSLCLVLSLAACAVDAPPSTTAELPADLAARARAHIAEMHRAGFAPAWDHAELGETLVLDRPDRDGIGYYDVAVLVDHAPAGHVVLATNADEQRVVAFATEGRAPIAELADRARAEGKQPARLVRAASEYAVEDIDGAVIATTVPSEADWRALEARPFASPGDPQIAYAGSERNCGTPEAPSYDQLRPGDPGNTWQYNSGCGATAWAMLIGWNRSARGRRRSEVGAVRGHLSPRWQPRVS